METRRASGAVLIALASRALAVAEGGGHDKPMLCSALSSLIRGSLRACGAELIQHERDKRASGGTIETEEERVVASERVEWSGHAQRWRRMQQFRQPRRESSGDRQETARTTVAAVHAATSPSASCSHALPSCAALARSRRPPQEPSSVAAPGAAASVAEQRESEEGRQVGGC